MDRWTNDHELLLVGPELIRQSCTDTQAVVWPSRLQRETIGLIDTRPMFAIDRWHLTLWTQQSVRSQWTRLDA